MKVLLVVGGPFLWAGSTAELITVEPHRVAVGYVALSGPTGLFQAPHWHLRALDDEAGAALMRARIAEEIADGK